MVWSLVLKLKGRGCDIFSNDSYHDSWGGGGGICLHILLIPVNYILSSQHLYFVMFVCI